MLHLQRVSSAWERHTYTIYRFKHSECQCDTTCSVSKVLRTNHSDGSVLVNLCAEKVLQHCDLPNLAHKQIRTALRYRRSREKRRHMRDREGDDMFALSDRI